MRSVSAGSVAWEQPSPRGGRLGASGLTQKTRPRRGLLAIVIAVGLLFACASAHAQAEWPTKSVSVVVGYAAGGNTDVMARMASRTLTETSSRASSSTIVSGQGAPLPPHMPRKRRPTDTRCSSRPRRNWPSSPRCKSNYDPKKDFVPVSIFGAGPFILGINASIPAKTLAEFVAYAKTRKINYGSSGAGSVAHLAAALFLIAARASMRCTSRSAVAGR